MNLFSQDSRHRTELARILGEEGAAWELWEKSQAGFAFVDKTGHIIAANPRLAATLGYADSEISGKHLKDITVNADSEYEAQEFRRLMDGEIASYQMVLICETKYRQRVTARVTVTKFGNGAEIAWSQLQPIDTLSVDSLSPADEERVTAMLLGRLIWENKRAVIVGLLVLAGIFKIDQLLAIMFGR